MSIALIILILLSVAYSFMNGFHDSSNIVATIISSRALPPRVALIMVAVAEFIGPFVAGGAVARTIGTGVVAAKDVTLLALLAALTTAILWNLLTWYLGIPSSSSHALLGGLIGAVGIGSGWAYIDLQGVFIIVLSLLISPILGLVFGFLITRLVFFLSRRATLRINIFFRSSQTITGIALGLSHGANDGQKAIGIMTLGLMVGGLIPSFQSIWWVVALSASAMALGTGIGADRLIKTLGGKFFRIRPVHGFCTQVSSALVIFGAALLGGPVSTTHVVSSAILGVGAADRVGQVRWGVARQIAIAWLLTVPVTIGLSIGVYLLFQAIF
jgi:inorganic phosphate transporter, PiT family